MSAPTYPTLEFLVRRGNAIAWVVALAPAIGGVLAWVLGFSIGYAIAGVIAAAFLFLIMRSYVELVRVIVDMLLPK
jgi:hypothetical protein